MGVWSYHWSCYSSHSSSAKHSMRAQTPTTEGCYLRSKSCCSGCSIPMCTLSSHMAQPYLCR